ncbi:MAG TPA: glycosyltransferase [Terriglobia bacterium]|nr:glycosyltransferase [Terriglobia bacterium]
MTSAASPASTAREFAPVVEGGYRANLGAQVPAQPAIISIVTVTLNALSALKVTVDSVAAQGWDRIEHIVVDGASTDSTVDFLRSLGTQIAYWRSARDKGIYDAMNIGMLLARGQYVLFLNSGDLLVNRPLIPGRDYGRLLPVLKTNVLGRYEYFRFRKLSECMPYSHQGILFRNRNLKPFDTRFRIAADYQFLLDNLENAGLSPPDDPSGGYVVFDATGVSSTQILQRDCESARIIRARFGIWHWLRFWGRQLPKLALRWGVRVAGLGHVRR